MTSSASDPNPDLDIAHVAPFIMDAIGQGLTIVDAEGRFTYVNPAYARMVGYTPAELIGAEPEHVTVMRDHDKLEQAWRDRRRGMTTSYETRLQHRNGQVVHALITSVPLMHAGNVAGSIAVITDLSERRKMEEALRRRGAFENLVTSLSTRFVDVCAEDLDQEITAALEAIGGFAEVDRAYVFLFSADLQLMDNTHEWCAPGITPERENLQGVPVAMLPWWMARIQALDNVHIPLLADLPPEAAAERAVLEPQGIQSLIAVPLVYAKQPLGFLGFDGVRRAIHWTDDDIALLRIIGEIIVSALQRRRSEQEIAARTQELAVARDEALEASETKTRFLATMSHELRTPLNAIIGFTELLLQTGLDGQQREFTETVKTSGEGLLALVNDILDLSRIEENRLELEVDVFEPRECLAQASAMVAPAAAAKGLALRSVIDPRIPPFLLGDALRLRQMLVNLLSNAVKFTERGEVSLVANWVRHGESGWALEVAVRDTGIGIASEHLARLFRPFSQADASTARRFGGSGLGLAITQRLTALMGGALAVESEPGLGSTFHLSVPLTEPSPEMLASSSAKQEREQTPLVAPLGLTHPLRILVADDSPVNRRLSLSMLAQLGYQARVVDDGFEALSALSEDPYDVVLLDIEMPGMDGVAVAKAIRERFPAAQRPHIVAVTAHALRGDRERFLAGGMDDYLDKPVRLGTLATALQNCSPRAGGGAPADSPSEPPAEIAGGPEKAILPPPLDQDALAELRSALEAANPEGFREMVDIFLVYAREQIDLLRAALDENDLVKARKAAHALASSAGSMGALRLSLIARSLEAAARDEDAPAASAGLDVLLVEQDRVAEALKRALEQ